MAVFKARARALDMLGRQQIAGIPTAISELFKNAHDAYADRVEVDYFRQNGLFILRDDGLGMTVDDFEKRWLTLGTESKLNAPSGLKPPPIDPTKRRRPVMGEKGIGRLAIAIIGPQVLILTRAKREEGLQNLVAAFIHWGMFELPGIDLDQIEIPIREFPGGTLPGRSDIVSMLDDVRHNLERLKDLVALKQRNAILEDLDKLDIDPKRYDGYLLGPALSDDGHGTHFYILPANETLEADLTELDEENASSMAKTLLGFTNIISPDHPEPLIKTVFRDHKETEQWDDVIASREFFAPNEFLNADHYIKGHFDEFGQFKGTVTVFGTKHTDHVVNWKGEERKKTDCGPFTIEIGYIMGNESDSTLPHEDFLRISRKLKRYGGLYIYRDNIRVLPYGDNDVDWIHMEKSRSKNARYYFFSYRRIFGLLNISHQGNPNLTEKAGREGFHENKAYRQFRDIIQRFFFQLAADFFRETGEYSEAFTKRKTESRMAQAAAQRERELQTAHVAFERRLSKAFQEIEQGTPQKTIEQIIKSATETLENIILSNDHSRVATDIARLETITRRNIRELREQYQITPPTGVGLSTELRRQSNLYATEFERLDRELFQPTMIRLQEIVHTASELGKVVFEPENRLRKAIDDIAQEVRADINTDIRNVRIAMESLQDRTTALLKKVQDDVNAVVQSALQQLSNINIKTLDEADIIEVRVRLEDVVLQSGDRAREILQPLAAQLDRVQWKHDGEFGLVLSIDETAALEEELLALRERTTQDLELVQLGMAIDIINHEFTNTITAIRGSLRRLQAWGDANPRLGTIYQNLRASFDHLDGYLTLFTPLHRRLYRTQTQFTGASIAKYLSDLFRERLESHEIKLEITPEFHAATIVGYPSTFYPVFVNLVDNATYWLQEAHPPRIIRLAAQDTDLLVSDTGPGVPLRDRDAIFQSGFTRKPGGRGLGLFISRDVLKRVGWQLLLDPSESGKGATFRIRPVANPQEFS